MYYTRNPAQNRQRDVDEKVHAAAALEKDCYWRNEDGEEVEADIAR